MTEIILASRNEGKLKEFREILYDYNIIDINGFYNIPKDIKETGSTFLDNALIKARTVYSILKRPILSEDSGLIIKALNGQPGVHSARYGSKNGKKLGSIAINKLILDKMYNVPEGDERQAYYEAFVVIYLDQDNYIYASGRCYGQIALAPKGSNGFGFDPIFYLPQYKKTFAQISSSEKHKISHRGLAIYNLKEKLKDLYN